MRSNVATVLVQKGTLTSGASIVAGTTWAKVRQMQDSSGRPIKSAGPGTPVSLTGWKDLPAAGDVLLQASTEDDAKRAITNRLRDIERRKLLADVEQINEKRAMQRIRAERDEQALAKMKEEGRSDAEVAAFMREIERRDAKGELGADGLGDAASGEAGEQGKKWLNLIIKADVSGTVEAVVGSLEGIGNKEAGVKVVGTGVGEVGESDVNMAEATGGAYSYQPLASVQPARLSLSRSALLIHSYNSSFLRARPQIHRSPRHSIQRAPPRQQDHIRADRACAVRRGSAPTPLEGDTSHGRGDRAADL